MTRGTVLLLCGGVVAGCAPGAAKSAAEAQLQCAPEEITFKSKHAQTPEGQVNWWYATGCGKTGNFVCGYESDGGLKVLTCRTGALDVERALRNRAADALECRPDAVQVVPTSRPEGADSGTFFDVSGCSKKPQTFVCRTPAELDNAVPFVACSPWRFR